MKIGDSCKFYPGTSDSLPVLDSLFAAALCTYVHASGNVNVMAFSAHGGIVAARHNLPVLEAPDGSLDGQYVVAMEAPAIHVDASQMPLALDGALSDGTGKPVELDPSDAQQKAAAAALQQATDALTKTGSQQPENTDPDEAAKNTGGIPQQAPVLEQGTVTYSDGTTATGTLPLPNVSPAQQEALMNGSMESVTGADGTTVTKADLITPQDGVAVTGTGASTGA